MSWFALQVISGDEKEVADRLKDYNIDTILPYKPIFLKYSKKINIIRKPLLPGYVIAQFDIMHIYMILGQQEFSKKVVRICGNGTDKVPLSAEDIEFLCGCKKIEPLCLEYKNPNFQILGQQPLKKNMEVEWYDRDRFKAKIHFKMDGFLKDHAFIIAAYDMGYRGKYRNQLQGFCR